MVFIAGLSFTAGIQAQERVRGRTLDEESGRPVPAVVVQVAHGDSIVVGTVETDSTGIFRVPVDEPGSRRPVSVTSRAPRLPFRSNPT